MEMTTIFTNWLPLATVLLPFLAGLALYLIGERKPGLINPLVLASTFLPFLFAASFYPPVSAGLFPSLALDILPPVGLSLRVDYLSFYALLLFATAGLIVSIYALHYLGRDEAKRHRFFAFQLLVLSGCYGVAAAGDFFTFYLFFEFMSIMFFVLVAHNQSGAAIRAAYKFLIMTIIAGVTLFLAVAVVYWETGTLTFARSGLGLENSNLVLIAFIGFIVAFGIKSALFPLHLWLPDAYSEAPLPAATISSMIMLKTGAYGLIRVYGNIYGIEHLSETDWSYYLLILAGFTILFGSIVALAQKDLIRRLAYSGIAQVGYIILGIALMNELALVGAAYHILAHAFMKGALFLCAGLMIRESGSRAIADLQGIGRKLPVTMICFGVATVTAVGMPPFNIFISKWHLGLGALAVESLVIVLILLASSMLNATYYLPIVTRAFLGAGPGSAPGNMEAETGGTNPAGSTKTGNYHRSRLPLLSEAPASLLIPVIILALGCFVFGLTPVNLPLELIEKGIALYF